MEEETVPAVEESQEPSPPPEPAPPILNRFLFVDVAAMRAKQLRRGALPRLALSDPESGPPLKAERIAMEEVRQCLVQYATPEFPRGGRN
ncbi:MAG: DNA-directed RNA polymerase subunit omega [Acidimicrobiia bacterium]|nr:DNA-directed RNA polymerase subunit omega [Acidimicrobiia bacterium]